MVIDGLAFGKQVSKALGIRHATHITIDILPDGPVKVHAAMNGHEGLEEVDWSQLKHNVQIIDHSWRDGFNGWENKLIDHCLADSACRPGVPGMDERRVIHKMALLLFKLCGEQR